MRRRAVLVLSLIALALLWRPIIQPAGRGAILVLHLFEPVTGVPVASWLTPLPREYDTRETFAGVEMRVSWWRPGWGSSHPAVMMVNGATPQGNDNAATRELGEGLARAGFLAMLPEFPFLKDGRFDQAAPQQLDRAFAHLRSLPETADRRAGAFGASVGASAVLVAAGKGAALNGADHLVVLGGYYDFDTYLASVTSASRVHEGRVVPWAPSQEVRERLPPAAIAAVPEADRDAVRAAIQTADYETALSRIRALPPRARAAFDDLSPEQVWSRIRPPVFWLHDPNDEFEPISEGFAAGEAPRDGTFRLISPTLIQHAEVAGRDLGPLDLARELGALLSAIIEILRLAD